MPGLGEVVVVDAVRTPIGGAVGCLNRWHVVDLAATVLRELAARTDLDLDRIDAVIGGCATPVGEQALNIARNAVLAAGWSEAIPAYTIDAHASSSMVAFHDACSRIAAGVAEMCVVLGVESTRVPEGASTGLAVGKPYGPSVHDRYVDEGGLLPPGLVAERLARAHGIDRAALDAYAERSRQRAADAERAAIHKAEIVPVVDTKRSRSIDTDELAAPLVAGELKPMFETDGLLTAATFAPPGDAAVAAVVARAGVFRTELAQVRAMRSVGAPVLSGSSGADLCEALLREASVDLGSVRRVDVREDTAATPLALLRRLPLDDAMVNPNGGALASGDPVGAAGLLTVTSVVHGLERDGGGYGLAVIAGATSLASAVLFTTTR